MAKPVVINEYCEKAINACNLVKLHKYLQCQKLDKALKVTPTGIKAKSWVGVIKYKNTHIQILPKLISDIEYDETAENKEIVKSQILKNLIYMLSYTKKLDIRTNECAKLSTAKNPFIEILIREYANSLFNCLKRLTPKKYVREEDNLNYLKGKIKFNENIKYNCTNQAKFYCEYDEFSQNNILNQLFLFVSTCLYNISNDSYNKKTLKFIMNYYSDIKLVRFDRFKAEKIKLSRSQELFKKPFNLAKMFVEKTSVDLSKNKFENITLIWDMNKLFEEFIFEIMNKNRNKLSCTLFPQRGRKLLIGDTNKKRNTFVDIMIEKDKTDKIVLDTKYKKFATSNDFSNSDVYQVCTYCLIHGAKKAILLYPKYDKDFNLEYTLNTDDDKQNCEIKFCTIDLKSQDLKKEESKIFKELCDIIEFKKNEKIGNNK